MQTSEKEQIAQAYIRKYIAKGLDPPLNSLYLELSKQSFMEIWIRFYY